MNITTSNSVSNNMSDNEQQVQGGNNISLQPNNFGLNQDCSKLFVNGSVYNIIDTKITDDSAIINVQQEQSITGGRKRKHRKVREFYDSFYQQIPQQYVQGFKDFFTYDPKIDQGIMKRFARGEYGEKFDSLYNSWQGELQEAMNDEQDKFNITFNEKIEGGLDDPTIDFTQQTPAEKDMILHCFNKDPISLMNIRNEELDAQTQIFTGGDKDQDDLQQLVGLRSNYQIIMSNDFISDYLSGGGYDIQQNKNEEILGGKKRRMRKHSKSKKVRGGFADQDIQPIIESQEQVYDYIAPNQNLASQQIPQEVQLQTTANLPPISSQPIQGGNQEVANIQQEQQLDVQQVEAQQEVQQEVQQVQNTDVAQLQQEIQQLKQQLVGGKKKHRQHKRKNYDDYQDSDSSSSSLSDSSSSDDDNGYQMDEDEDEEVNIYTEI